MIVELERDQFYKCTDLVNCTMMLESKAIVAGNNPGRIFVDHGHAEVRFNMAGQFRRFFICW